MYHYTNMVRWDQERRGTLKIVGKPDLFVATPPEFGGHEGIHSPEDLFVASLNACVMSTFLAFAERTRSQFQTFQCTAEGTLEKMEGKLQFTKIVLSPKIHVPSEEEKNHVLHTLELVEKNCLVTNSVKCTVEMYPEIVVSE